MIQGTQTLSLFSLNLSPIARREMLNYQARKQSCMCKKNLHVQILSFTREKNLHVQKKLHVQILIFTCAKKNYTREKIKLPHQMNCP